MRILSICELIAGFGRGSSGTSGLFTCYVDGIVQLMACAYLIGQSITNSRPRVLAHRTAVPTRLTRRACGAIRAQRRRQSAPETFGRRQLHTMYMRY